MKLTIAAALAIVALLSMTACSAGDATGGPKNIDGGTVAAPSSSDDLEGRQYEDVVREFEDAGFLNVEATPLGDLITGWLKDPGEVKEVTVAGSSFEEGDRFAADAAVVVAYHSYSPDREDDVLTIDDSEALRALLAGPSFGPPLEKFVDEHQGETIQFDGYITYFLYGSSVVYSTADVRFGDAGADPGTGPTFRFTPMSVPKNSPVAGDKLAEGMNVRVTATIGSDYVFEDDSFYDPATQDRIILVVSSLEQR